MTYKPEVLWQGKAAGEQVRFVLVSQVRIVVEQGDLDSLGQMSWRAVDRIDRTSDGLSDLSPVSSSGVFEAIVGLWSKVPRSP